jgi:hypothetical protein
LLFAAVWVVGLQGVVEGEYVYNVTSLDIRDGNPQLVHVGRHFGTWTVKRVQ